MERWKRVFALSMTWVWHIGLWRAVWIAIALLAGLAIWWLFRKKEEDARAWIQAFGPIAALVVAIIAANYNAALARRQREKDRAELRAVATAVATDVMADVNRLMGWVTKSTNHELPYFADFVKTSGPRAVATLGLFSVQTLPDAKALVALYRMSQSVQALMDQVKAHQSFVADAFNSGQMQGSQQRIFRIHDELRVVSETLGVPPFRFGGT